MVNHAMNNETAKVTVVPYKTGTVNHATMNKMVNITDTVFVGHACAPIIHQQYRPRQIKNYTFG